MRLDAGELVQEHAQELRPGWDFQLEQLLDRQAIAEVVGHRTEVVDAVGEGNYLLIELGFAGFLDAGVEKADIGNEAEDGFAIDFEHQAEHAMGRGMLGAHVEDHGAVLVAFLDPRFDQRGDDIVCGIH